MIRSLLALPLLALFAVPVTTGAVRLEDAQGLAAYEGRPAFKEGSDLSYFVWRDGNSWHVRWTSLARERVFTGTVRATGGKLEDLKRIDVDEELKIVRLGPPARVVRGPGGRVRGVAPGRGPVVASKTEDHIQKVDDRVIRWNATADDDIDGFSFKVDGVSALAFDLNIAGRSRPLGVEIGRNNIHPEKNPFIVRLN
jgi:hypothetical protein